MTEQIVSLDTYDVRFPTSRQLDGSDAMNPFPDYSAAYVVLRTSAGREGYGLAFTVGRGNDVQVAGIQALAPLVVGRPVGTVKTWLHRARVELMDRLRSRGLVPTDAGTRPT